jgi:hypothetical protein
MPQLEECSPSLRALGDQLFELIAARTGFRPEWQPSSGWYKARSAAGRVMYLKFLGDRARKNPPQSALLTAEWDASLAALGATKGNNMFGRESADLSVVPTDVGRASAEQFIRLALG